MLLDPPAPRPLEPEDFLVEPLLEIGAETLSFRAGAINAILRAHLLGRQEMQLDEVLGQLFDLAGEVVYYDGGFAFFCEEEERHMRLRVVRDVCRTLEDEKLSGANLLNYWTAKYWRPLLLQLGQHPQVDDLLRGIGAGCVLALPLFAGNRPRGALQLFGVNPACFATLDAQLLWILALAAERLFPVSVGQSAAAAAQGKCEERLERELVRAEQQQKALTLLLLEIDRFQMVSDVHGRQAGDAIRSEVFSALTRSLRGLDCVMRYGDAGFAVILPDTSTAAGYCVAERLKQELEEKTFSADASTNSVRLTMSLGLAVCPADAQSARELLQTAGLALNEAQHNSRSGIALYSEFRDNGQRGASAKSASAKPQGLPRTVAPSAPAMAIPAPADVFEDALRPAPLAPPKPPVKPAARIASVIAPAKPPVKIAQIMPLAEPPVKIKVVSNAEAAASKLPAPDWMRICDFEGLPPVAPSVSAEVYRPAAPAPVKPQAKTVIVAEAAASEVVNPDWMQICDFEGLPPATSAAPLAAPPVPPVAPPVPEVTKPRAVASDNLPIPAFGTVLPTEKPPLANLPSYSEVKTDAAPAASPAVLSQRTKERQPLGAPAAVQPEATQDIPAPSAPPVPALAKAAAADAVPASAKTVVAIALAPQSVSKPAVSESKHYTGKRREQRMEIALPVQVWGMDVNGELFEQDATTVDITTVGARVEGIVHRLERGCVVGIKHQTSKARYRVKWVGAEGSPMQGQIGLQLLDEGKLIWGRAIRRELGDDFKSRLPKPELRPN